MHRFDIEVEGSHNYFVDGVMVHNSPETTPGGRALKFYSSVRLDIRRIEAIKDGVEVVGNRTRVKVVKNKVRPAVQAGRVRHHVRPGHQPGGLGCSTSGWTSGSSRSRAPVHLRGRAARPGPGERQGVPDREPRGHGRGLRADSPQVGLGDAIDLSEASHRRPRTSRRRGRAPQPRRLTSLTRRHHAAAVPSPGGARASRRWRRAPGPWRRAAAAASPPRRHPTTGAGRARLPYPRLPSRDPALLRPHLRVPDERARLRAHRRPARGRRHGRRPTTLDDADVVVLNTCCIRENADNKLYGHLGHLKAVKDDRPDLQIAVAGCLAQKDRELDPGAGPPRRRGLRHPQRAPGRRPARPGRGEQGPSRDPRGHGRSTTPTPSPRPCPPAARAGYAAWVTIQIGCDNSCAFCIVPAVRGPEISRPFGDDRRRGRAAGRRRRGRGHPAGPERQLLRPRPHRAQPPARVFADLLAGTVGADRRHPAGPLHQPPPQGPAARDHRRHGRGRRGVRAPAPAAAVGQRPRPGGHAPRLHRRALPASGWPRPAPRSPTWPSPPTSSWASPARPTTTSSARSRWRPRPSTTAPTRSSTRPGRAPRRPTGSTTSWPRRSSAERFERLRVVVERSASAKHAGPGRPHRGGPGRRPEPAGSVGDQRPHPPEQAGPLRRRRAALRPGTVRRRRRSPGPAPTSCAATCSRSPPAPATAPASRWSRG